MKTLEELFKQTDEKGKPDIKDFIKYASQKHKDKLDQHGKASFLMTLYDLHRHKGIKVKGDNYEWNLKSWKEKYKPKWEK